MAAKNNSRTLVRFENGVEIRADNLCCMVFNPTGKQKFSYFPSLDGCFSELLDMKIKELASSDSRKTMKSLGDAIAAANQWIKEAITKTTKVGN